MPRLPPALPSPATILPALLAVALLAGCRQPPPRGPIEVAVIGPPLGATPPAADRGEGDATADALLLATRQGLVRFDAGGQVVPGLAARWIVSDTGRSLLFRLPDREAGATSPAIARRLRAAIAAGSANPLRPLLGAIAEVDAVTPQVVDVELSAPRPNLLPLFAQAPLTVAGARGGPFELVRVQRGVATLRLRAAADPDPDEPAAPAPPPLVRLRGARAGAAVARFAAGAATLVTGGRFEDLPVARAAALAPGALRFDPAPGLFGLAFAATDAGFAADPDARRALAMAIDRDRIARALDVPGWAPATAIVPAGTPEVPHPATPDWAGAPLAARRTAARDFVTGWRAEGRAVPPLRVAMPPGPGARLLFALLAADWRDIGVPALAVGPAEPADLRLIDEVAPADTAAFYLRSLACERGVPCTANADALLVAARYAPSLAGRSALFAQADALMVMTAPFIALGSPVRWSLVSPSLDLYRDSPRAIHPLDELRTPTAR